MMWADGDIGMSQGELNIGLFLILLIYLYLFCFGKLVFEIHLINFDYITIPPFISLTIGHQLFLTHYCLLFLFLSYQHHLFSI